MKRFLVVLMTISLCLGIVGCGGGNSGKSEGTPDNSEPKAVEEAEQKEEPKAEPKADEKAEPSDLSGTWVSEHDSDTTSYHAAVIDSETITIYWYDEEDESFALYWTGSYTPPDNAGKHIWDSINNKEATGMAFLASGDDTKEFTFENDIISYSASAMGVTKTMKLLRDDTIKGIEPIPSPGDEKALSEKENGNEFDAEKVISQIEVTEYQYVNIIKTSWTVLVLKNNSDYDINIEVSVIFKDADGKMVGVSDGSEEAFEAGSEIAMSFNNDIEPASIEYELSVKEEDWYECVLSDLSSEITVVGEKAIISVTNNGEKPAEFVEYTALFLKDGKLVQHDTGYCVDDDSELKPGKTINKEADAYEEFDDVKVYFTGRR